MSAHYESELTRFLRDLKQQNPAIAADQKRGRAIWWDKNLDRDLNRRFEESGVPQAPYVYQPKVR
jgi:hypothetical protein